MNLILGIWSFIIVAFGQPAWIRGFGVLAAAFGFALFWRAILPLSKRDRFIYSLIWFACVQGVQLSWMATMDYMGPLIIPVYLFLIFGMGIQFAILSLFLTSPMSWGRSLAMAGSWTIFEWLRLFFLCGFTWNPVGLSLADSPYSIQFASIWGIFGLSFWVMLVNLAALNGIVEKTTKRIAVWAVLALLPYGFGAIHQYWIETHIPIQGEMNVVLVQTALFPEQKDYDKAHADDYIHPQIQWERIFSVLDREKKVDLVVLPEAALPMGAHRVGYDLGMALNYFRPESLPPLQRPFAKIQKGNWKISNSFMLQALANQLDSHVIAGLDDADFNGIYNAAFHFSPSNGAYMRYEKRVLAPIAEYIPLRNWTRLTQFIGEQFGIYSSFDPGTEAKIFNAKFPVGVTICLEETFSDLTRDLRLKGAEVFVNLTNDAWFPSSKLPRQHFDHGRVRAAENGVPLLRACNTGITGAVDSFGSPIAQLPISEEKPSSLYFSLPVRSYATLYTWWGDQAILGISFASIIAYSVFRGRSGKNF